MTMIYDEYDYKIPEGKRIRLIIDSDVKNEADDPYAIIHALLSPKFDNRGIVAAHFGSVRSPHSMQDSDTELKHILQLMGLPEGWTAYGNLGQPISDNARCKALGNAIALPCADYIMAGIAETIHE
ncbi:MAG: hypothetical protein KH178_15080 [Roseburia sp.]|nr:hypothetical protein [Roseburia sp.]